MTYMDPLYYYYASSFFLVGFAPKNNYAGTANPQPTAHSTAIYHNHSIIASVKKDAIILSYIIMGFSPCYYIAIDYCYIFAIKSLYGEGLS